jgi:hypothetical protein
MFLPLISELATALGDFGEAVIHLGTCEGGALGNAFTELGNRSDVLSTKSEKQVGRTFTILERFQQKLPSS